MQFAREAPADGTRQTNYKARRALRNCGPAASEKRRSERRRRARSIPDGGREWETYARTPGKGIGEAGCLKVTAVFTIFRLYDKNRNSYCMAFTMCHRPERFT